MLPEESKSSEGPSVGLAAEVRGEVERVCASTAFRGSPRCKSFLDFVVTRALDGDTESLKERTLAVELFGRKAAANLADDSIVRVGAREVRKRLEHYYVNEGARDAIRIELPSGSYVPVFHRIDPSPVPPAALTEIPGPDVPAGAAAYVPPRGRWFTRRRGWAVLAVLVLAVCVAAGVRWRIHAASAFEVFWRPVMTPEAPVLIGLAHPLVYHPSSRAVILTEQKEGPAELPLQRPVRRELLTSADFVPVFDQYTGLGDAVAVAHLSAVLTRHSQPFRVRSANSLNFNDFRDSAAILIGAFTNRWAAEFTRNFRFRFLFDESRQPYIFDSQTGKPRWLVTKTDSGQVKEDCMLICRIPRSKSGHAVIILAGLTQYGTHEAGRILAEPDALASILKRLPPTWPDRNLQIVLRSLVVGDAATQPELAGWHIW